MKMRIALSFATVFFAGSFAGFAEKSAADLQEEAKPVVQLAILLDNSGSMNGLITQAKSQLWSIVNEFISAKQDGKAPRVQVALFEYGVNDLGRETGYIRKLSDLTDDLDKLSEQLFSISTRTSGSDEYCGMVLKDAVEKLDWDKSNKTYKAVFIAGNEPFTQGPVHYESACKAAIAKGIIVNTIHCGSDAEGVSGKWRDAAALADGKYLLIDHNAAVAAIAAPQDKDIAELNTKLNTTYVSYGLQGAAGRMRQEQQDLNAAAAPAAPTVVTARALSKASANYSNSAWDLVDRAKQKDFDITKVKDEELPEELRKMTMEERKAYLAKKTAERAEIQKRIADLAKDRDAYVANKMKEQSKDSTLGGAVTGAVREQAAKKGVTFGQ
jgi:hypothetical protein